MDEEEDSLEIEPLFKKFNHNYLKYLKSARGEANISELIKNILDQTEDQLKSSIESDVENLDSVEEIYDEINALKEVLFLNLLAEGIIFDELVYEMDEDYWNEKIELNEFQKYENTEYEYEKKAPESNDHEIEETVDMKIERLFD